ncbi:MAG: ABC transporter permease [Gaiellales bacterium]
MFLRDLRDAIRDGRILIAVLLPVGLAVYYGIAFADIDKLPSVHLQVVGAPASLIVDEVRTATKGQLTLTVKASKSEHAARSVIKGDDDSVALVLDPDVDEQLAAGKPSAATVLIDGDASGAARQLAATVEAVAANAGTQPLLTLKRETLGAADVKESSFERLGLDRASIIFSIVMLSCFVAFLAVPVLLMEEVQLRTLEALQLVATTWEIILAKLLVGLTYCAVAIMLTIALVNIEIASQVGFVAAALALSVVMVGFGLAFGLALGDPGRVNTWSGVVLLPLIIPVFIVLGGDWSWVWIIELLPTGGGALLLAEAVDPAAVTVGIAPMIALVAWGVAGFGLLWWLLERRDA